jgi:hypothetical protein
MVNSFTGRKDILIILLLMLSALFFFVAYSIFFSSRVSSACIIYEGEVIETVNLDAAREFSVKGHENVVFEVYGNKIAFKHSDCPDKICVNTGFIHRGGQTAACLPNKLVLRIERDIEVDAVVR